MLEPADWAVGGNVLVHRETEQGVDLYVYSLADRVLRPWVTTPFREGAAATAPDGRFAAYVSEETGRKEIWVQTFPEPGDRWRVSVDGGDWPAWREDGNEIYYIDPGSMLVAVPVLWREDGGVLAPDFGAPESLFRVDIRIHFDRQYDTRDGQTFLLNRVFLAGARDPLTLVQNWQ
jgi:hypothetical protein